MKHKVFVYCALILKCISPSPPPPKKTNKQTSEQSKQNKTHTLVRTHLVRVKQVYNEPYRTKITMESILTINAVFNVGPRFLFFPFPLGNGRKRDPGNEVGLFVDAASVPFVNGRCHFLLKRMKIATQG